MAKQIAGLCFFEGTIDDLTFYKMDGQYYVRVKSSLSSKRVKTSPEFKWTMFYASLMARASRIGSIIYKSLPPRWRQFWMFRSFTGEALTLLKENPYTDEDVKAILWQRYVAYWEAHKAADPDNIIWQPVPAKIRKRRKYSEETIQRWIASGKLRDPAAEEKKRLELEQKRERVRAKLEREKKASQADMVPLEVVQPEVTTTLEPAPTKEATPVVEVVAASVVNWRSSWHVGLDGGLYAPAMPAGLCDTLFGVPGLMVHEDKEPAGFNSS